MSKTLTTEFPAKRAGLVDRIARLGAGTGLFILYCTTTALIIDLIVLCLTGEIR